MSDSGAILGQRPIAEFEQGAAVAGPQLSHVLQLAQMALFLVHLARTDRISSQGALDDEAERIGECESRCAGNITDIGNNRFLCDRVSRIKNFEFDSGDKQAYTYDVFGNLTSIATTPFGGSTTTQSLPVAGLTNRLNGAGYDGAGNQTAWPGFAYTYDAFGMMTRMTGGGNDNTHVYTADDERLWTMDFTAGGAEAGTVHTFRLRDADGKALRELRLTGLNLTGNWSFRKDYIHRDAGRLLASVAPGNAINHFTLDHLGTPRLVTNSTGGYVSDHHYYAYGQELNTSVSDPMKFAGHERDFNEGGVGNTTDELDYMHARYCSPVTGRFLATDTAPGKPQSPQSWNRYSYVLGNPLKLVDPDGRESASVIPCSQNPATCGKAPPLKQEAMLWAGMVGAGVASVAAVVAPELAVAAAVRFPALFATGTTILAGLAEQPMPASVTGPLLQVSSRNLKHIGAHLSEFQALDRNATVRDVAALGQRLAADVKNFVRTHGEGKLFEATVKIGGKVVKVRVFVNPAGGVRSVYIPRP